MDNKITKYQVTLGESESLRAFAIISKSKPQQLFLVPVYIAGSLVILKVQNKLLKNL